MKWKWNPYPLIMSAVLMNSFFSPVIFLPVLSSSLPIMIHCLLTKNIQPRAVRGSVALSDKPRCWFWGQRRRMRAEKLKREACEVLRFRSHKYPQEEKPRQSTCDTSAETRRQTRRGGREGVNNSAELLSHLFVRHCQKRLRTQGVFGGREGSEVGGRAQSIWSTKPSSAALIT